MTHDTEINNVLILLSPQFEKKDNGRIGGIDTFVKLMISGNVAKYEAIFI